MRLGIMWCSRSTSSGRSHSWHHSNWPRWRDLSSASYCASTCRSAPARCFVPVEHSPLVGQPACSTAFLALSSVVTFALPSAFSLPLSLSLSFVSGSLLSLVVLLVEPEEILPSHHFQAALDRNPLQAESRCDAHFARPEL